MKPIYKNPLFWLGVIAVPVGVALLSGLEMTTSAETTPDSTDGALRTRDYKATGDINDTKKTIEDLIPTIITYGANWRLIDSSQENDTVTIKVEVPVLIFTDDLKIEFSQAEDEVIVNASSHSRIGSTDFGENRRHIIQLFGEMDKKFKADDSEEDI